MELRKLQLKVQALLQKVSTLVTRYENELADLRVEYTIEVEARDERIKELSAENSELAARVQDLESRVEARAEEDQDDLDPEDEA